jgi:hypothetical protein
MLYPCWYQLGGSLFVAIVTIMKKPIHVLFYELLCPLSYDYKPFRAFLKFLVLKIWSYYEK